MCAIPQLVSATYVTYATYVIYICLHLAAFSSKNSLYSATSTYRPASQLFLKSHRPWTEIFF